VASAAIVAGPSSGASTRTPDICICGVISPLAEIGNRRTAAHALDPDVLDAWQVGGLIDRGDEHVGGERLVNPIPLPVKVSEHYNRIVIGLHRFELFGRGAGALKVEMPY